MCDGAKLAGILIEGEGDAVAVGIGVNCRHHPTETSYPATDLSTCGAAATCEDLMGILSRTMANRLAQWQRGAGFAAIRADWAARAHRTGARITVRVGQREAAGHYQGLDDDGRLLLRRFDGSRETISAGDVFPLVPITGAVG